MPLPFRIHQTRIRPERILVKLIKGLYIIPSYNANNVNSNANTNTNANTNANTNVDVSSKKNVISMKQIKQVIKLLQSSEHKNLKQLLSPELKQLLSVSNEDMDVIDEEEEEEIEIEESKSDEEDEDVLIIDV
jgi:hypothetical protein